MTPALVDFLSFFPKLVPLGLLVFWLIRVRLTGWYKTAEQGI